VVLDVAGTCQNNEHKEYHLIYNNGQQLSERAAIEGRGTWDWRSAYGQLEDKKQGFLVSIQHPSSKQMTTFKYYDERQKSDTFMNVMNGLCFSEKVS
jgi:hypothetical protein